MLAIRALGTVPILVVWLTGCASRSGGGSLHPAGDLPAAERPPTLALHPGHLQVPSTYGPVYPGVFTIYFGGCMAKAPRFPVTVFQLEQSKVVLDRAKDGTLILSGTIVDDKGKILIKMDHNSFYAPPSTHVEIRGGRWLMVDDSRRTEILDVYYLNPLAVRMRAMLRAPGEELETRDHDIVVYTPKTKERKLTGLHSTGRQTIVAIRNGELVL